MQMGSTKKEELSFESMLRDIEKQTNNLPEQKTAIPENRMEEEKLDSKSKEKEKTISKSEVAYSVREIMGEETQNLPGQIKFDLEKEEQNSHSEQQNKKLDSKQKLQEFLESTTDIYSGKHRTIVTSHTATIHKITPEEVNRFRKFDLAESQVLRYKEFKKLRKAKAAQFVLDTEPEQKRDPEDKPNQEVQLPELDLYEDELKEEAELEYNQPSDAAEVGNRLKRMKKHSLLRLLGTAVLGLLSLYPPVAMQFNLPIPPVFTVNSAITYLLIYLLFGLGAIFINVPTFISGLKSFKSLAVNRDTLYTIPMLVTILQDLFLLIVGSDVLESNPNVFLLMPLAIWGLAFRQLGQFMTTQLAIKNFPFVSSTQYQQYASGTIENNDLAAAFTKGTVNRKPYVGYNRKTGFLSNFIYYSFLEDITDQFSFYLVPAGAGLSLVLGAVCGYMANSFPVGITAFTVGICISAPLCHLFSVGIPMLLAQKKLSRHSAVLLGYEAVQQFGNLNAVLTSAHDLFPKGTVVLQGMKSFSHYSIDHAIIDAASVLNASNSILRDMFMEVLLGREDLLKPVDSVVFEDTMGISAWVDNRRVIIGNREMLINHNIEVLSEEKERKLCPEGCEIVYIAVSGILSAAFIFSVRANKEVRNSLEQLISNGIYLVVQTVDPMVTQQKLAQVFQVDEEVFKILPARFHEPYQKQTGEVEKDDSPVANNGRFSSYVKAVLTAKRLRPIIYLLMTLSVASIVFGLVILFVLGSLNSLGDFNLLNLLGYELVWAVIAALIALIKRA